MELGVDGGFRSSPQWDDTDSSAAAASMPAAVAAVAPT